MTYEVDAPYVVVPLGYKMEIGSACCVCVSHCVCVSVSVYSYLCGDQEVEVY